MGYIEKRMAQLPGMAGLDCCTGWATKIQPMLPEELRSGRTADEIEKQSSDSAAAA